MLKIKKSQFRGIQTSARNNYLQNSEEGFKSALEASLVKVSPEKSRRGSDASQSVGIVVPPLPMNKQKKRKLRQKQQKEVSLDRASMSSAGNSEVLRNKSGPKCRGKVRVQCVVK